MKKWIMASLLGLGSLMSLGGCMHLFIDADDKETKALYLYATGTTVGNISGGGRSGVDAFCVSNKPPSLICTGGLHAFINVNGSDKVDFFLTAYPSLPQDLPVYNLDKTKKIADDWADLLDNSIDMSLADAGIATVAYWTGGVATDTCAGWMASTTGHIGSHTATDSSWFNSTSDGCSIPHSILCLCWD